MAWLLGRRKRISLMLLPSRLVRRRSCKANRHGLAFPAVVTPPFPRLVMAPHGELPCMINVAYLVWSQMQIDPTGSLPVWSNNVVRSVEEVKLMLLSPRHLSEWPSFRSNI